VKDDEDLDVELPRVPVLVVPLHDLVEGMLLGYAFIDFSISPQT
jgi:hypothetical protein